MYINFWYPIGTSDEVKADEPLRSQLFGLNFVAFRDKQGVAHVLSDTCVHRGGSLSKGWIKDGCVVCPYHGWQYEGDGKCTTVPSIGLDGKPPARAKVDSYPVQEKYGIVFAFLGDLPEQERPALYEIPEWGKEGWRTHELIILDVDYYYERSMENGIDPAHNEFVHPTQGFAGTRDDYYVRDFEIEEWPLGCGLTLVMESSGKKDEVGRKIRDFDSQTTAITGTYGPNTLITFVHLTPEKWLHQYFFEAPLDGDRTRIYFINMRNMLLEPDYDEGVKKQNLMVADQDITVLSELNPIRTPDNNTKEIMMPADKVVLRYREWLKEWENNGWRIDAHALKEKQGDVAFAIPCPERRTSGNWVLDTVPLMPAVRHHKAAAE